MSPIFSTPAAPARWLMLGLLVVATPPAPAAGANESFYESLLREGETAAARADWPRATARLRLACFGLLDSPARLADCLTRLALAQSAADDREGFRETADRLLEVEQRFGAFSAARLDAARRTELETALARWIEPEKLLAVAIFEPVGRRLVEAKINALPLAERRRELEARLAAEPDNRRWTLMLAAVELDSAQPAAALEVLGGLLAATPPPPEAICLRGVARSDLGACADALADLPSCASPATDLRIAEATLSCQVRLGRWAEADALLATLPESQLQQSSIRRLSREVRKGARTATREAPATTAEPPAEILASAPAEPEPAAVTPATGASAAGPAAPSPALSAQLAQARDLLASAATASELGAAFESTRRAADANPTVAEAQHLVAEIAYRTSRWPDVIEYFRRGGPIDPARPDLVFYLSVAYYETGDRQLAAATFRTCQGRLKETAFVRAYTKKILGGGA